MRSPRSISRWAAFAALALAWAGAVTCTGTDVGESRSFSDIPAEVAVGDTSAPPQPECDPAAAPTGCAEGAVCWFHRCVAFSRAETHDAEQPYQVGSVASVSERPGDALVAFHARRGPSAGGVREDLLFVVPVKDGVPGVPELIDRWELEDEDANLPGPRLAAALGPQGEVVVVRGPNPLRAYERRGGAWLPSALLPTGGRIYGAEGALAAAYDADGRLHVAFHDVRDQTLEAAVLGADGTFTTRSIASLGAGGWGAQIGAVTIDGRVVVAHVSWGDPDDVRGVLIATQDRDAGADGPGWRVENPALAEGLTVRGQVVGFAAVVDPDGRLTLGWLTQTRRLGVAVRQADGTWQSEQEHFLGERLDEELYHNLALAWWQGEPLLAWIAEPSRGCDCLEVRMALRRDGEWREDAIERFPGREPGQLALAVDARGGLVAPVGGGPLLSNGTPSLLVLAGELPDWARAADPPADVVAGP